MTLDQQIKMLRATIIEMQAEMAKLIDKVETLEKAAIPADVQDAQRKIDAINMTGDSY